MSKRETVLVVGNYRPSLTVVRSLEKRNYRIIAGTGGVCFSHRSRACSEAWDHPSIEEEPKAFIEALVAYLEDRPDIKLVFPVSEPAVVALSDYSHCLPRRTAVACPARDVVRACLEKVEMLELAGSLAVPTPPFALVSDLEQIRSFLEANGYPVVIRPTVPGARLDGKKALILHSERDLDLQLASWPDSQPTLLIQTFAGGMRHNVYFLARRGRLEGSGEVKILRTDRLNGTGLAVSGISVEPDPLLRSYLERIIRKLDYHGVGCAQFHVDRVHDSVAFLELNPRLGANFAIVDYCGLPLAPLVSELVLEGNIRSEITTWQAGKRYAWIYGDLAGLIASIRAGDCYRSLLAWPIRTLASVLRADVHLTWSMFDPMPTLATFASVFSRAFKSASAQDTPRGKPSHAR